MADRGNELEKFKRQASDLIADLHSRNLAIPAGILLVLIVGAILVLPKSSVPPPAQTAPTATKAQGDELKPAQVANLKLVDATPLKTRMMTFGTENPFALSTDVRCREIKGKKPKAFVCVIGDTLVWYQCMASDDDEICSETGASGSTGSSGSGGGGGGTDATGSPDGGGNPNGDTTPKQKKSTYYVVDVELDGKTVKSVEAGDALPTSGSSLVFYAGPTSSNKKAIFVLADGISVQGADADPDLGTFELSAGDEVVLTTAEGESHQLQLRKLRKVTK